ncbi:MAG: hypothetical protein QOC62_4137, partial [Mycobacterium sp.]|nr:hypothetical protein [Mycobacterium sp.]
MTALRSRFTILTAAQQDSGTR